MTAFKLLFRELSKRNNNLNCRLPCSRILKHRKNFLLPEKHVPSKKFSSLSPSRYYENNYDEIRSRLAAIPTLDLLNKNVDSFQYELFDEKDDRLEELLQWCSEVYKYVSENGRLFVSHTLLKSYCTFGFSMRDATWNQWDSDGWRLAVILALCVELNLSYILTLDDIVDQSDFRRGNQCLYKKPDVGLSAINDSLVLQWSIFKVLRKRFSGLKCFSTLLEEFLQGNLHVAYGQCMDGNNGLNRKSKFDAFTFEKYKTITEYKTGHCFFRLPVHLAMHLAGGYSAKEFDFTTKLSQNIGLYFQSKDDLFDYVFPMEQSGLKETDIRQGRLTWLSAKFFEEASESMKNRFMENYGIDDDDAVGIIQDLYKKSSMVERFKEFEEQLYTEISTLIESKDDIKGALFYDLFHEIQNRK